MSASSPSRSSSAHARSVVARLRAAGCVFAEDEARLLIAAAPGPADLAAMVDRRAAGQPIEHVLGWAEFCGLRVAVDPGVFVPRRRTEFLARQAVALARQAAALARQAAALARQILPRETTHESAHETSHETVARRTITRQTIALGRTARQTIAGPPPRTEPEPITEPEPARPVVVDLCCGSGAVGMAVAAMLGRIELHAVDIDPAAVRCARRNVAAARGQVYEGDLDGPLPARLRGHVDVLVSNAPYVPTGEVGLLPAEARVHEPRTALDGGADGLDVLRRVAGAAPGWLAPGGHLLVEASERQAPLIAETFAGAGLSPRVICSDEWDATVVFGTKAANT